MNPFSLPAITRLISRNSRWLWFNCWSAWRWQWVNRILITQKCLDWVS